MPVSEVFFRLALIVSLYLSTHAAAASPRSSCSDKLPAALSKRLAQEFPSFRLPRLSEYDPQQLRSFQKVTRRACPGVVFGDFDGDRRQDVALVLTHRSNKSPQLIIALRRKTNWHLYMPRIWCNYAPSCYVDKLRPGIYTSTQSHEIDASDATEQESLSTRHTSVLAGKFEATSVLYVFSEEQWLHVVLSD